MALRCLANEVAGNNLIYVNVDDIRGPTINIVGAREEFPGSIRGRTNFRKKLF